MTEFEDLASPTNRFDRLYKTLLTPISLITTLSFNAYLFLDGLLFSQRSDFADVFVEGWTPRMYLEATISIMVNDFILLLGSMVIFSIVFFWVKRGAISGRCVSLFLLLLSLLLAPSVLISSISILPIFDFRTYFVVASLISFLISFYVGKYAMKGKVRNLVIWLVVTTLTCLFTLIRWV